MLNRVATVTAALAVLGASSVCAQPATDRGEGARPPAIAREDSGGYLEARISALHSGLLLTPEQERLWPAFEQAYRELAKLRPERGGEPPAADDPVARMQRRADALTRRGTAVKALAEAAAPLWGSFGDGQKRRFAALARPSNFRPGLGARDQRGGFGSDRDRYGFRPGRRDFGPDEPGRGGDLGPRRFGGGERDGAYRYGERRGFEGSDRDGDYGRGPRDFGPQSRGRDGDGDRYGFGRQRGFGPRGFDGPGRDGDYGYGERRGEFGSRDRDGDYGRDRGRDGGGDRYGFGRQRGFGPRGFGGPSRDGDYGYGERRGFGAPGFGRESGRGFGDDYDRGRLPWWHPDVGR